MRADNIQVVAKEPGKAPVIRTIANTLSGMREIVGGTIEIVRFDPEGKVELVCNDDFLALGMKPNVYVPTIDAVICGPFFMAAPMMTPDGVEFRSMTDEETALWMERLRVPSTGSYIRVNHEHGYVTFAQPRK
jgi:hypothetical protein